MQLREIRMLLGLQRGQMTLRGLMGDRMNVWGVLVLAWWPNFSPGLGVRAPVEAFGRRDRSNRPRAVEHWRGILPAPVLGSGSVATERPVPVPVPSILGCVMGSALQKN